MAIKGEISAALASFRLKGNGKVMTNGSMTFMMRTGNMKDSNLLIPMTSDGSFRTEILSKLSRVEKFPQSEIFVTS